MRVVKPKTLKEFASHHSDSKKPLETWYNVMEQSCFQHIVEVQQVFPSAETVGRSTVFNIKNNKYRLITAIHYNTQMVYVLEVMTHAEYSKNEWKKRHSVFDG